MVGTKLSKRLEITTNVVLLFGVLFSMAAIIKRMQGGSDIDRVPTRSPTFVEDWREMQAAGHITSTSKAKLELVVFGDYECPACRYLHGQLSLLRERLGDSVSIAHLHYPLGYHQQAMRTATAAECAASQGVFFRMHDKLFNAQGDLGKLSMDSLALAAGVRDIEGFRACRNTLDTLASIRRSIRLGNSIPINGTPAVLVNGWLLKAMPSESTLYAVFRRAGKGERLFD